jgi:hypothetical protein
MGKVCPVAGENVPDNRDPVPKQVKWENQQQKNTGKKTRKPFNPHSVAL